MTRIYTLKDAAEIVGMRPGVLLHWARTGRFVPSVSGMDGFGFTDADIERLLKFVAKNSNSEKRTKPAVNPTETAGYYTVAQLAKEWGLSADAIRRQFENEPGVLKLGDPNPKYRRKRITMRIPAEVARRVHKRLSAVAGKVH